MVNLAIYQPVEQVSLKKEKSKGFTLVELLVVISIIALLASIALGIYANVQKNSRDAKRQSDLRVIQSALEQYKADQNFYPSSMVISESSSLTNNTGNPSPPLLTKTYLKRFPVDPNASTYPYKYQALPNNCDNSARTCTSYCLYAKVENSANRVDTSCPDQTGYDYEIESP